MILKFLTVLEESEIIDEFIKNYDSSWKGRYYRKGIKVEYYSNHGFNKEPIFHLKNLNYY